jgi:lipopolysaccharide assembly outer membrane protein LptD (OstA)
MPPPVPSAQQNTTGGTKDAYGYPVFNVPWTLNMSYSLSYVNSFVKPTLSQTLSFNGNVALTKKMSITYTSGYDFTAKKITMTNIGVTRDLHCWEMNLNWIPNGTMQSWNFTIRVKASVLGDLKYERRKDFHDSY